MLYLIIALRTGMENMYIVWIPQNFHSGIFSLFYYAKIRNSAKMWSLHMQNKFLLCMAKHFFHAFFNWVTDLL